MSDAIEPGKIGGVIPVISRRDFIKGVIAGGAGLLGGLSVPRVDAARRSPAPSQDA